MSIQERQLLGRWSVQQRSGAATLSGLLDARSLGWLSLGLGITAALAPRALARLTGLGEATTALRLIGCRELASGAGLLTQPTAPRWLWSRIGGDMIDLLFVSSALRRGNPGRTRALRTLGVLAAITAVDLTASLRASREEPRGLRGVSFAEALIVNKAPEECYRFWRDTSNLPKFISALESVTAVREGLSRWVFRGPSRRRWEWISQVIADEPGSHIGWRSIESPQMEHAGSVHFRAAAGKRGTLVRVSMHYRPVAGRNAVHAGRLIEAWPRFEVREDLRRFKQLIETGEIATTLDQPSGRRSVVGRTISAGMHLSGRSLS